MAIEVSPIIVADEPEHLWPLTFRNVEDEIRVGFITRFEDLCIAAGATGVEVKSIEPVGEDLKIVLSVRGLTDEVFDTVMFPLRQQAEVNGVAMKLLGEQDNN